MAKNELKWKPVMNIETTLKFTINWYEAFLKDKKLITSKQIDEYIKLAKFDMIG